MYKFVVGETVFHYSLGFSVLEYSNNKLYPFRLKGTNKVFSENGFTDLKDKFPSLLTIEQAESIGYYFFDRPVVSDKKLLFWPKYKVVFDGKKYSIRTRFGFFKDFKDIAYWHRKNSEYFDSCWTSDAELVSAWLKRLNS